MVVDAPGWPTIGPVLFDRKQIADRVTNIGEEITEQYLGRVPIVVSVLRGATIFVTDLSRALGIDHELDFLALNAFGQHGAGNEARVLKDLQLPISGRDVILVEDIVDTGLSINFLLEYLRNHKPASIEVCTLLDRPHRRLIETPIAWTGFTAPDRFVVGYGFDYQQRFRNLPDIHELPFDPFEPADSK
jgi:hypoxanthine phosphoribosyltransferase